MNMKIEKICLSDIEVSQNNVRLSDPMKDIDELAASIKKHGLLQPIILLGDIGSKKPYKLISGQRRLLAHKKLHEKKIDAIFIGKMDRTNIILRSLVENMQRVDLDYADTSKAVTELYLSYGKDEKKVERETGLSLKKIREFIEIEAIASPKIKRQLKEKKVTPIDVKRALRATQNNLSKAERLIDLIIDIKPTTDQKRRIIDYGKKLKSASAEKILEAAMQPHIERNLVLSLSTEAREALIKATKKLNIDPEELTKKIIEEWLIEQGFSK